MSELISIVTPLYNGEKYIAQTIESVLKQSYTNWEMNIVDDCSTDKSAEIVAEYVKNDKRIKYYKLEKNSGAAVARNTSIEFSLGKYLAFLDSDDTWYPEKLKYQIDFMKKNNIDFSFSEYCMIDDKDIMITSRVKSPDRVSYKGLLSGYPIMCSSVIINKNKMGDVRMPNIRSGQDYATWAMLLKEKIKFAYNAGKVLAVYRKVGNSLSSNKMKALKRTWFINRTILGVGYLDCCIYIIIYGIRWLLKHYIRK